jgi:hypothetical protein
LTREFEHVGARAVGVRTTARASVASVFKYLKLLASELLESGVFRRLQEIYSHAELRDFILHRIDDQSSREQIARLNEFMRDTALPLFLKIIFVSRANRLELIEKTNDVDLRQKPKGVEIVLVQRETLSARAEGASHVFIVEFNFA